jgi:hypothetical protein
VPFVVEMTARPRLAINGGGASFMGSDGGLVDFDFSKVRSIRFIRIEAA